MSGELSPAKFIDELRRAAREIHGTNQIVLVLEGGGDHQALALRLSDWVNVRVAGGKEKLIAAYRGLEPRDKDQMVFVIDCDGNVDVELKGQPNLILTTNRDVEADLFLTEGVLERVIHLTLPRTTSLSRDRQTAIDMAARVRVVALRLSAVLLAANSLSRPIRRRVGGRVEKFGAAMLSHDLGWSKDAPVSIREIVSTAAGQLEWGMADCDAIVQVANELLARVCRRHDSPGCEPCTLAAVLIGHQAVASTVSLLSSFGAQLGANEIPNLIYAVSSGQQGSQWEVARRLARWADSAGLVLWAD